MPRIAGNPAADDDADALDIVVNNRLPSEDENDKTIAFRTSVPPSCLPRTSL